MYKAPSLHVSPPDAKALCLLHNSNIAKKSYLVICKDIKISPPQLFYELSLDGLVPADNFYRRVNQELDLRFLYQSTQKYYGTQGQESIDPVVFFKILLVGYLNNINSDRALIRYCSNCFRCTFVFRLRFKRRTALAFNHKQNPCAFWRRSFLTTFSNNIKLMCW